MGYAYMHLALRRASRIAGAGLLFLCIPDGMRLDACRTIDP